MLIRINDDIINLALVTLIRKRKHNDETSVIEFTYPDSTVTEYYFSTKDAGHLWENIWKRISETDHHLRFESKEL